MKKLLWSEIRQNLTIWVLIYVGALAALMLVVRLDPQNEFIWFSLIIVGVLGVMDWFVARHLRPWVDIAHEEAYLLDMAAQQLEALRARRDADPPQPGENPANQEPPGDKVQELAAEIARLNERLAEIQSSRFPAAHLNSGSVSPPEAPTSGGAEAWIDYYHAMKERGFKVTFADLSDQSGYSEGTLRNLHVGCEHPACAGKKVTKNDTLSRI